MTRPCPATIRPLRPADLAPALALNNRSQPMVNALRIGELGELARQAAVACVADDGGCAGLLIALPDHASYGSLNFAWLQHRLRRFLYIDRVAVAPRLRGVGLGRQLYRQVWAAAGRLPVVCEVNLVPANPGSLAFHRRLGFRPIGRMWNAEQRKLVVFLRRDPAPDSQD